MDEQLLESISSQLQIFLWVFGMGIVPWIGWAIHIIWLVRDLHRDMSKVIKVLEDPDAHGIGTGSTKQVVEENTKAIEALTHYVRWLAENQTGQRPPPFVPTNHHST